MNSKININPEQITVLNARMLEASVLINAGSLLNSVKVMPGRL